MYDLQFYSTLKLGYDGYKAFTAISNKTCYNFWSKMTILLHKSLRL